MKDNNKVMNLAYEAGSILLENGAEISRVDETIRRIANHYGVDDVNIFVLSNGIMATSSSYARSKFIPIRGSSLDKVVAVNQLSRDVSQGKCDIVQLEERIKEIRAMKNKPAIEQIAASAFGSAAFCIIFGGGFLDTLVSFIAGLFLWVFILFVGYRYLSRIVSTVVGALIATFCSIVMFKLGLGTHLSNIIIGAIIPLIPGMSFTNGIRDLANEDYLSGITRLLDAMLTFLCIALGVAMAFVIDAAIYGEMHPLEPMSASPETAGLLVQLPAAFISSVTFAILFGVPRKYYFDCGICGTLGWLLYLILIYYTSVSTVIAAFMSAALLASVSLIQSIIRRCPSTVFLISGLFPLVPGAGVFWTTYNMVSNQLNEALHTGFMAVKITIAIAFGILIVMEINSKKRIGRRIVKKRLKTNTGS